MDPSMDDRQQVGSTRARCHTIPASEGQDYLLLLLLLLLQLRLQLQLQLQLQLLQLHTRPTSTDLSNSCVGRQECRCMHVCLYAQRKE